MAAAVGDRSLRKTDDVTTGFGAVEGIPSSGSRGIVRKSRRKTTSGRLFLKILRVKESFQERLERAPKLDPSFARESTF